MMLGDALAWLDGHQNLERMLASSVPVAPDLSRMQALVDIMDHPEAAVPVIHITGTNGKTSTARSVTQLLMAKGLTVGTFTSPHLETINERLAVNGEPIGDSDLAEVLSDLADLEGMLEGHRLTWFEILAGAALRWFADRPVDVVVMEVGLGGRWDATNVVDATVAVVTNVGLDHVEFLGPTRADIAREKSGIVKPRTTLVLAEPDPALLPIFEQAEPRDLWLVGREWACTRNELAVGGRVLDVRSPGATYEGIWLDLHGAHQARNFAAALVATEAFFAAPVEDKLVRAAASTVRSPGRFEVVGRSPLIVLDGAKNLEGARSAAIAVAEEFAGRKTILVVGMLAGKDPTEMLSALGASSARLVVACSPPSPRAQPASAVAAAAASLGVPVQVADSVPEALALAVRTADSDDVVLVAGSLYVVGAARAGLAGLAN